MIENQINPAVEKLLAHAKFKGEISYDEINDFLPDSIINSDKIEDVMALLEKNNISIVEIQKKTHSPLKNDPLEEDGEEELEADKIPEDAKDEVETFVSKKVLHNDKDSSVDDPIRFYLREIGKEHLLTAEQEVSLSKKMEQGENIIKGVIRSSGIVVVEMLNLQKKITAKVDPKGTDLTKKEVSDLLAEKRRLSGTYKEGLREINAPLKSYMEQKKKVVLTGGDVLQDEGLAKRRKKLIHQLDKIELHPEEISSFSEKFLIAEREILRYQKEQARVERQLRVSNSRELRSMGRGLAVTKQRRQIEEELQMTADVIKQKIRQIQLTEKKLRTLKLSLKNPLIRSLAILRKFFEGKP